MKQRQDWLYLVLGSWVLVSPWILRLSSGNGDADWGTALLGAALVTFAAPVVLVSKEWEQATTIGLGLVLLASPWVLDFTGQTGPLTSAAIVGTVVVVLGVSSLVRDPAWFRWQRLRRKSY